jgi:hypothetical protein
MTITALYAGILALLYIYLAANVIRTRGKTGVSLGDGGNRLLERRIRAHGNFAEYVPFGLLLMACLEVNGLGPYWIHLLGITLVAGRTFHAAALSSLTSRPVARTGGMVLTLSTIGLAAIACIVLTVQSVT